MLRTPPPLIPCGQWRLCGRYQDVAAREPPGGANHGNQARHVHAALEAGQPIAGEGRLFRRCTAVGRAKRFPSTSLPRSPTACWSYPVAQCNRDAELDGRSSLNPSRPRLGIVYLTDPADGSWAAPTRSCASSGGNNDLTRTILERSRAMRACVTTSS